MMADLRPALAAPASPAAAPTDTERTNEEAAPLESTERQRFPTTNPGFGGDRKVTARVAASIYKPGVAAETHRHAPNASRAILSDSGGHGRKRSPRRQARRPDARRHAARQRPGDVGGSTRSTRRCPNFSTPSGRRPPPKSHRTTVRRNGFTERSACGRPCPAAGLRRCSAARTSVPRSTARGTSPEFRATAATADFSDPATGSSSSRTLGHPATLSGETAAETRSTAGASHAAIAGKGRAEVDGESPERIENDFFAAPGRAWRRVANETEDAIAYGDRLLLEEIGRYRRQGRATALES